MIDLSQFEGHTPGPWEAWEDCSRDHLERIISKDRVLAHTIFWQNESEQNTRLMAAAPDLLAEVKELRKLLRESEWYLLEYEMQTEQKPQTDTNWHRLQIVREDLARLRAAIGGK